VEKNFFQGRWDGNGLHAAFLFLVAGDQGLKHNARGHIRAGDT